MSDNPFSDLGDYKAPADQPEQPDVSEPKKENPFAQLGDYRQEHDVSTAGAFGIGALQGVAPSIGGLAGAGYGAEAGAMLGEAIFPVGGGLVGGFLGGLGGAMFGGGVAAAGQDAAIKQLPHDWRDPLEEYQRSAEEQHPMASFLGGLVPMALTMSPKLHAGEPPPPDATTMQRILANPQLGRLFGGVVQGGIELGDEKFHGQDADWAKIATSTAFGMLFSKTNSFGQAIEGSGSAAARRLQFGAIEKLRRERAGEPQEPQEPQEPPTAPAREPTILDAQDLKVAGLGVNEDVHNGSRQQPEMPEMTAREAKRTESLLTEPEPEREPDVASVVHRMEPELIEEHDALRAQRDSLAALAEEQGPDGTAAKHLSEVNKALAETTEQVKAAYARAAELTGAETVEPSVVGEGASAGAMRPEAPTPPAAPGGADTGRPSDLTGEAARQWVADDLERRLIASGRTADEARAAAEVLSRGYARWADRLKGKLGDVADWYLREHPDIVGPDGQNIPAGEHPGKRMVETPPAEAEAEPAPATPASKPRPTTRKRPKAPASTEGIEATEPAPRPARVGVEDVAPPPRVGEEAPRQPTQTEIEAAAAKRKSLTDAVGAEREVIAKAREFADRTGATDGIADMIALWHDPEEAASALWSRDKFWSDAPGFEWNDEETFANFVEQIGRSLGAPFDDPVGMDRWATNWFARDQPQLDFDAKPVGTDKTSRRKVGTNAAGETLWEDSRGVRSIVTDGIREHEKVRVDPRGGILVSRPDGSRFDIANFEGEEPRYLVTKFEPAPTEGRAVADDVLNGAKQEMTARDKAMEADMRAQEIAGKTNDATPERIEGDDLHNQAVAIWHELKELGTKDADAFAGGIAGRLAAKIPVAKDTLDFYRRRLVELKSQAGGIEKPAETKTLRDMIEAKDRKTLDALDGEAAQIAEHADRLFAEIVKRINEAGFTVDRVDANSPRVVQLDKRDLSEIGGAVSRLLKGEHALTVGKDSAKKTARTKADREYVRKILERIEGPKEKPPEEIRRDMAEWARGAGREQVETDIARWETERQNAQHNVEGKFGPDGWFEGLVAKAEKRLKQLRQAHEDVFGGGEPPGVAPVTERATPPEAAAPPPVEEAKPAYGANNKLVTADRAAQLRERLKAKLREASSTLNSGIDPEFLQLGTELAVFHVEAGARSFADFARAISTDLGAKLADLRPFLRSWYNGARDMMEDHGYDVADLDTPETVRTELNSLLRDEANERDAIREDGAGPLAEVLPSEVQGLAGSGDAERASAEGQPDGVGSSGPTDAGRVSEARGRGNGSARTDNATARKGRVKKPSKVEQRLDTAAEEVQAKNPAFEDSPSISEHETANINIPDTDFTITDDMGIGKGGEAAKFADNLEAIRTLKRIEAENRRATPEEKAALARYVGWGGLKNAFRVAGSAEGEGIAKGWEKRVAELEGLLTPLELRRARNSTTAAHYTSPLVVRSIWAAVKRLGFNGGSVLEPSVGTGNFLGMMPEDMRGKSNVFGVEYDNLTARIAQKLYPNADIVNGGFQDVPLPENQFALAIGNPPFGADKLFFRFNPKVDGKTIHNQFFLQSMNGVRPGGLLAMVVSHNLMDALDNSARLDLARQGKFLGAIRLPDMAFQENARTEVVTDIIFLQKHAAEDMEWAEHAADSLAGKKLEDSIESRLEVKRMKLDMRPWVESRTIDDPAGSGEQINANNYFTDSPEMVIGKINATGKMNRRAELNVQLDKPEEFQFRLMTAIGKLPKMEPREGLAASSLENYKKMADGMRLSVERAEPGRIRQTEEGALKTVVDIDPGPGRSKSVLQEIDLTPDTPLKPDYTLNMDGKWQITRDVLEPEKLGADGKPLKEMGPDGKMHKVKRKPMKARDANGKPTSKNMKETVVYDNPADIPDRDKWGERNINAVKGMLKIRDAFKAQLQHEMQDSPPDVIEASRAKLNEAYDAFTKEFGEVNSKDNDKLARTMPDGGLITATEDVAKDGSVKKSAIMSKRVTQPPKVIDRAANVSDAVAISLGESGKIDVERIASFLKTDEAGAMKALSEGEKPRAFFDPEAQEWKPADMYLSGLVRKKLLAAREHGLEANIAALEKVIPEDWDSSQIEPKLGGNWIPTDVYKAFFSHLGYEDPFVDYTPITNTFSVGVKGAAKPQFATSDRAMKANEIVSRVMNSQPVKVMTKDADGNLRVDEEATTESQVKANELMNEFQDWVYRDDARREVLTRIFNDKFNSRVIAQRDGSHLTLPGKVPDAVIEMRQHQSNGIWRGITDKAVLYDHAVGAGKTFTAIARIMERRRMGLSRKPLVVVPNHVVEQWGKDVTRLYPGANVLVAGPEDFERGNRRRLFARIAAGDYDMTIIGHSSFGFIDIDPSTEQRYLDQELIEARNAVKQAEEAAAESGYSGWGKPMGVKDAERLVTKIETRLARLRETKRDRLLTFEEMGIDDLTVDEAHEFKNLAYSSRLTGVYGMGNKAGSGKASDLHMKVRSLHDRQGTSVAFLTGTPISNSVSEMYLLLRNLVPNELKELGLENFDAWRTLYVGASSAFEPTEAGGLEEVTRLGREWSNMRSLMELYYSVADAVSNEEIQRLYKEKTGEDFPIPKVASKLRGEGDREMVAVKPSNEQRKVLAQIVSDFANLPNIKNPIQRGAERLKLMDRARKISLDPRALDPRADVKGVGGKLGAIVDRVHEIYKKWDEDRGTQLVFLDRSVPKAKGGDKIIAAYDDLRAKLKEAMEAGDEASEQKIVEKLEKYDPNEMDSIRNALAGGWNAYDEIKRQLVAKGIPPEQVRFVQEASNKEQLEALFDQVRSGEVRVLIGSTPRMGAGTNVQDRLVALHHADVTWKPSDIEQREGRIIRQGNKFLPAKIDGEPNPDYKPDFKVDIMAYATEMTIDAKMWNLNATKLKAINGIRKYDGSFNMEFEDAESASMAEMAALATGNPLMIERVNLHSQIGKLEIMQRSFLRRQNAFRDQVLQAKRAVESNPGRAAINRAFAEKLDATLPGVRERSSARRVTIDGKDYGSIPEALVAAKQRIDEIKAGDDKGRFVLEVNGEKLTTVDNVEKSIRAALGTANFEATVNGRKVTRIYEAAVALEQAAKQKGAGEFTLDGIQINGLPVEIDIAPDKWGKKDAREVVFSVLNENNTAMASYRTTTSNMPGAAAMSAGIEKIIEKLNPENYRKYADHLEREAKEADKKLPGLQIEADRPWHQADELALKRERYKEVNAELASSDDSKRLLGAMGDEEGGEPKEEDEREFSQAGDTKQGKITFRGATRPVIRLFQSADASTFMHETAHDWLEKLMKYASHEHATDDLREDAGIVRRWLGAKETGPITARQHERFARGFEQYLREGVAPSRGLAGVFAQFKNWLMSIYQTVKSLGHPINDDIRGVFDRMLEANPERTVIAPERGGPSLATIHEHDAAETLPHHAEHAGDRVLQERDQAAAAHPPEIVNEHAKAEALIKAEREAEAERQQAGAEGPAAGTPEPSGQGGAGASGRGQVEGDSGAPEPFPIGGSDGERSGEVERGGGEPVPKGNDGAGQVAGPVSRRNDGPPIPEPVEQFTAEPDEFAGNIRVKNVSSEADVWKLLKDVSEANGDFMGDRNAPQSWGQTVDLAEGLGMTVDDLLARKKGQAFNAAQAWAALQILKKSAHEAWTLAKAVENGTDEDAIAYAEAMSRHGLIQSQFAGITSEAGRTLNIYKAMRAAGEGKLQAINEIAKGEASRTLYQIKKEAKLVAQMDDTRKVSKLSYDKNNTNFSDNVLEYWLNGLISGLSTHVTYSIGNLMLATWKAGPETAIASVIGKFQKAPGSRVQPEEVGAQFRGGARSLPAAVTGAVKSFREGGTLTLPGEKNYEAVALQPGQFSAPGQADLNATWKDAAAETFGLVRGIRDAFIGGAALLKAGGIEGEPTWGFRHSGLGLNPDVTFKGVGVLPIGTLIRVPSRGVAAIHTFFRVLNYSMEKSSLAMRQAIEEGHQGDALAARAGELWQSPTDAIMAQSAHTATDMTLMSTQGDFTRKVAALTNARWPILNMRVLKFIDPFVRISSNVIDQTILHRTPVGMLTKTVRDDVMGRTGISDDDFANGVRNNVAQAKAMSRMLAGTATAMLFGSLAGGGLVSGSGPTDPRKAAMWRLAGNQAHSVRIGDMWYDMHRLGPLGMLASTAADLYDVAHEAEQGEFLAAANALWHGITQNILDESFMRGPAELIRALDDPGRYGEGYLKNWAASFLPYSVGMAQMARAADPYSRNARSVMDEIKRRVPGLSESLLPKRDIWGNEIANPTALLGAGITAIYERQMSNDPVNKALWNLGIYPARLERKVRGIQLSDEQYDDFQRIAGFMMKSRLDKIVGSPQFSTWPANVQHDIISETIQQSKEAARGVMMMKFPQIMRDATLSKMKRATGEK